MKHIGSLIKKHIEDNHLIKRDIADIVGITPNYLSDLFKKSSFDCDLFDRICKAIGMSPSCAFDDRPTAVHITDIKASTLVGPATITIGEAQALRDLLAEKERLITILLAHTKIGTNTEHDPQ